MRPAAGVMAGYAARRARRPWRPHHRGRGVLGGGDRLIATWRGTIADEWRPKRTGHFDRLAARVRGLNLPGR